MAATFDIYEHPELNFMVPIVPCGTPEGGHMASIKPWKNGKFRVTWYDGAGVRHNKYLPKQAAQDLYDQVCAQRLFESSGVSQALGGKATAFRKMKFRELAERYKNEHLLNTRAQGNAFYIEILIDKWGEHRLNMINLQDFRAWIKAALKSPIRTPYYGKWRMTQLAARSVEKLDRYGRRVFTWGIEQGIIAQTPFIGRTKDAALKKEFRRLKKFKPIVLSVSEFWEVVNSFPSFVKRPSIIAYFTGLRRAEVVAMQWGKLDRKKHCLSFDADEVKETDSKTVYYDPECEQVFEELEIERLTNGYRDDFVFRNDKGGPLTAHSFGCSVLHWADAYAEKSGKPRFAEVTPHTFRRSYRTRKDIEGADRKAIAANMGHHSLATSEIYNIVSDERQMGVAGFLDSCGEDVRAAAELLMEAAKESGADLSEVQSQLRQMWQNRERKSPVD